MIATSTYLIVFRIIHVVAAIAWGGTVFLFVVYVQPTAAAIGPAGAQFMRELLGKRRLVNVILWMAATTIVGGAFLYWHDWQLAGSLGHWLGSRFGFVITIGSVAAIVSFVIGLFGTRPGVERLLTLGGRAAAAGGDPSPDLTAEIQATQTRLRTIAKINLTLVTIAALAMATARHW